MPLQVSSASWTEYLTIAFVSLFKKCKKCESILQKHLILLVKMSSAIPRQMFCFCFASYMQLFPVLEN